MKSGRRGWVTRVGSKLANGWVVIPGSRTIIGLKALPRKWCGDPW